MRPILRSTLLLGTLTVVACEPEVTSPPAIPAADRPSQSIVAGSGTWTSRTPSPVTRSGFSGAVVGGKVYVVGGVQWPGDVSTGLLERYTPSTDTWETLAP